MFLRPAPFLTGLTLMLMAPATSSITRAAGFPVQYQPLLKTSFQFSNYIPHRGSGRKDLFKQIIPAASAVQHFQLHPIVSYGLAWQPRSSKFTFQGLAQIIRAIKSGCKPSRGYPGKLQAGCVAEPRTHPESCCTWRATTIQPIDNP